MSNICAMDKCTTKLTIASILCKQCNQAFCTSHRMPEVHGPYTCAKSLGTELKRQQRSEAMGAAALRNRNDLSTLNKAGGASKEHEAARKRLREQIRLKKGPSKNSKSSKDSESNTK